MLKYKENFSETKKYFEAFWQKEVIDRPLIAVTCLRDGCKRIPPAPYMSGSFDGNYLNALKLQENFFKARDYSFGEAIPTFECTFGADQFAGFLGANIKKTDTSSWAEPFIESFDGYEPRIERSKGSLYNRLMDFMKTAADYAEGKFLVNVLDFHSNLDALSAIRSPSELCMDMILDEKNVQKALEKVCRLYPIIFEEMIQAAHFDKTGMIGWAPTYCEKKFATVQCDFCCMIGPEMGKKFVIPAIESEINYLDHCVYHYDGKEALQHLDNILAIPKIDVIQWVPGDGNPRSIYWMELLHKIQDAGKGLWIYDWTPEEIKAHFKELKPEGLIFQVQTQTQKEAEDLVSYVKNHM